MQLRYSDIEDLFGHLLVQRACFPYSSYPLQGIFDRTYEFGSQNRATPLE